MCQKGLWSAIPRSIFVCMVSIQNFDDFSMISNFFCKFKKIFPSIAGLGFARCETPFLTYSCVSPHFASVSRGGLSPERRFSFPVSRNLHFECFTVASLESARLGTGSCLAPVSRNMLKHHLVPPWHSPDYRNRSHIVRRIFLRTQHIVRHQSKRSRLRHHQIRRSRLRHRRTFSGSPLLPTLRHSTLFALLLCLTERNGCTRTSGNS